ncbi:MAG: hypothetical protein PUG48_05490 [Clostridia bacterium]|nr:hypothetical protein [Clostridia bacterium]
MAESEVLTPEKEKDTSHNSSETQKPENDKPQKDPDKKKKKSKKKSKKQSVEEVNIQPETENGKDAATVLTLRRRAGEVKKYAVMRRLAAVLAVILIAIITVVYAVSYFYDQYGSFTVKIDKYDMVQQGLSLSETPEFDRTTSRLNANIVYDMTNISGEDLPANIDRVNGSHNGDNYIAYTFYLTNSGKDTLTYSGELYMESITGNVDEAIRVAVYRNGEKTVYGKTKSNGGGIEKDCDKEFASARVISEEKHEKFRPGQQDKYTIVIWLEGNDPDCTDEIVGGQMKMGLNFKIIEDT